MDSSQAFLFGVLGALSGMVLLSLGYLQRVRNGYRPGFDPWVVCAWTATAILACGLGGIVAVALPSCPSRGDAFVFGFAWESIFGAGAYGIRFAAQEPAGWSKPKEHEE